MPLISSVVDFIKNAVGNNMNNDHEDVMLVKRNLNKIGYFDNFVQAPEPHGYITKEIDKGVWDGEAPYRNRFDFKPDDKAVPIPQIIPPQSDIDRTMNLPYTPDDKRFFRKYEDI